MVEIIIKKHICVQLTISGNFRRPKELSCLLVAVIIVLGEGTVFLLFVLLYSQRVSRHS